MPRGAATARNERGAGPDIDCAAAVAGGKLMNTSLLTCEPGPDIVPLHDRQVVIVEPADWGEWLTSDADVGHLLRPAPAGHIKVERVN